jgi:anti-sigma B factor antagonist
MRSTPRRWLAVNHKPRPARLFGPPKMGRPGTLMSLAARRHLMNLAGQVCIGPRNGIKCTVMSDPHDQPPFEIESRDGVHVIRIHTHVTDRLIVDAIAEQIRPLALDQKHPAIIIDFTGVTGASSSILGVIMSTNLKVARNEGKLRLCGMGPEMREIFRLTKLDAILSIDRDLDESLHHIA